MSNGYWLVRVNRETGDASTEYIEDQGDAWMRSLDEDNAAIYTTVVNRHIPKKDKKG